MPQAQPRRRNARGQGRLLRSEITEASERLIDNGAEVLTLRAVAREAGIAGPSIYDHFSGLEEIRNELVGRCFAELIERLVAADASSADPCERLDGICDAYVGYGAAFPHRYALLYQSVRTPERTAASGNRGAAALQILVDCITDCVAAGRSASANPYDDAVAVWAAIHGLTTLRASRPDFRHLHSSETLRDVVHRQARIGG